MVTFKDKVLSLVKKVPKGKVVSYGQIAAACGSPRAARQVGWVLRGLNLDKETIVPWWRVVNNQGIISIKGNWTATKELQRALLVREKIKINDDFTLDMKKYRFKF